ncbi:MAG TPA: ABC transporter ATP-binding protein [Thermoanaerobaculia bacterium]|nr:ABC transporter ATP-binding protein [Thermoanaerobaculia bacterium]
MAVADSPALTAAVPATLTIRDVRKSFASGRRTLEVLRGISLELRGGEALAVTGPSGSGKSTLLHLIGTLDRPTSGSIELDGRSPHDLPEPALAAFRNRNVGFVFQDHHLLPQYTVLENVLLPTFAPGADAGPEVEERARELIARVGLGDRLDHRPAELSGGEAQRVAVARALVQRPRLLLCDEPTGNLDATTARSVTELLFELHAAHRTILIVVTHSLELAERLSRWCELREGRCVER